MKALITGGLLLLGACAQHSAKQSAPEVAKRDSQGQDIYECRAERQTGTIISERVCRKRSEIEADRNSAGQMADSMTRRGTQAHMRELEAARR